MEQEERAQHRHVVITGTGRTGTTFLVQLLTNLGLDTGFKKDIYKLYKTARAGLEHDVRDNNIPYIVKHPQFCDYVNEVLDRDDIIIDHVLVPMRDLNAAAQSRWNVVKSTRPELDILRRLFKKPSKIAGGLLYTNRKREQETVLVKSIYNLFLALSGTQIPITIMRYPKIVQDSLYLFEKLTPILKNVSFEDFDKSFKQVVQPEIVHRFNNNDI